MKKKYFLSFFAALLLCSAGCNKVLDVPGNAGAQIVTSQVFTDSANATAGVLGLYQGVTNSPLTGRGVNYYTSLSGDEGFSNNASIFAQLGLSLPEQDFYNDAVSTGTINLSGETALLWSNPYGALGIFGANTAMEGINADHDSSLSLSARNQLIGECKTLRAYHYFSLVNLFGDVPLVLSTDWKTTALLPRASADAVYAQITKDLQDASGLLSGTYPSAGRQRPNRYVALGLLARVYLYRKQWDLARAMVDSVIGSGLYSLVPTLDNIFLDKSTEAIWQIGNSDLNSPKTAPGMGDFVPLSAGVPPTIALNPSFAHAFETGDKRKTSWTRNLLTVNLTTLKIDTLVSQYKYRNTSTTTVAAGAEDLMVLRLAEMYLIRAEAVAQLGDPATAMSDVNVIRKRAGLPAAFASNLSEAMGIILHERQVELFVEGHRWFDLKRVDSVNAVMARVKPQYWPVDGHAALYPLPYTELSRDVNLVQNPGY
ncbi:MAG TPA: RagB/SusD family nutrient uptake outer membrane protein [Puia sp.]|jgi:hypothetical protein